MGYEQMKEEPGNPGNSSTDRLTAEQRSRLMSRVRHENTAAESRVQQRLTAMGYSYSVHSRDLPGTPDIVLLERRTVIFVHGCFWHGHDCKAGKPRPKSHQEYWSAKLADNRRRDSQKEAALRGAGWNVFVIWECETKNTAMLDETLLAFLGEENSLV
jgi:DNA mismatch endonuclease, patch repair protein